MRLSSLPLLLLLSLLPSVLSHSASPPASSLADSYAPSASTVDPKSKEHPSLHDTEPGTPPSSSKSDSNTPSASPLQSEKPRKKHEHEHRRVDYPVEYSFMFEELDNAPGALPQHSAPSPSPYPRSKPSKKQKKKKKDEEEEEEEDEDDDDKEESNAPSSSPDHPKSSSSKKDNKDKKKSKDKKSKFVWGLSQGVEEIGPADDFSAADAPDAGPLTTPSSGPLNPLDTATICGMSGFLSSCMSAVEAMAPGLLGTTNAATILNLTSKATLLNTRDILDKANKIVKKPENDPETVDILLKSCVEQYQDAIEKLEGAEDAVTKGDKNKMRDSLMVAEQYKSCRAAFAEVQMKLPQGMKALDETLKDLAGTNMALAKFFWPDPIFDTAFMQTLVNL